jgi:general secretion pathway protein A
MDDILASHYGLTFHPFRPDVPVEALSKSPALNAFLFRLLQQLRDGGFAAVTGEPGTGKSTALRITTACLETHKDVSVAVITRPQCNNADFYRELGHLFNVGLSPHNRWAGSKVLRETWLEHIDKTRTRPVIIVDEAQEMKASVLAELRLLSTMNLDARSLLTVILAGDDRLAARLRTPDLLPIHSRIRSHLTLGYAEPDQLRTVLDNLLEHAGRPDLMTDEVKTALATHAHGNLRAMMTMADNLLSHAMQHDLAVIDEQAFFDLFHVEIAGDKTASKSQPRSSRRAHA